MIGKTISHYKILKKLGEGGMGIVYKARDSKLDRLVALKFLPPHLSGAEQEKKRFIQEAKAASALDHPNIGTIYEIDETGDRQMFIAMACYEGESLKDKIARGPLAIDEAIDTAIQIAQGLAKAHSKEIVHRDIKPANILITEYNQIKIVDFGLAKLAGNTLLTKEGTTLGTVAYMSPEQAQGKQVDQRTDIWALGVMIYEMLAGANPFSGEYELAVMYSIISEDPEFISKVRSDVPPGLEKIVEKALQKNPDKRYQTIEEMLSILQTVAAELKSGEVKRRSGFLRLGRKQRTRLFRAIAVFVLLLAVAAVYLWQTGNAEAKPVAIAILPLKSITEDSGQEWFSDGMTDALITDLAKISGLRVISRSSVMGYKGTEKPMPQIARELDVDYVVDGSVSRIGDQVKISARLVNASEDQYVWADAYERAFSNVLALQEVIAQTIADQIQVKLTPQEQRLLTGAGDVNPEAYEAYLKGNFYLYKFTPQSIATSQKYYQMALEINPQYARAYAGIALSHLIQAQMGYKSINTVTEKAEQAIAKALQLDSTLAEIHYVRAVIEAQENWNWTASVHAFEKTIRLNPNMAKAHAYYSHVLFYIKKPEMAMNHIERAIQLDPFNPLFKALYGMDLMYAHEYDKVINMLEKTLQTNPGDIISLTTLRSAYHQKKMYDKALQTWKKYFEVRHDQQALNVLNAGEKEGGYSLALQRVAELWIERSKTSFITPWQITTLYTRAGMKAEALNWLEKAFEEHDPNMPYLIVDPIFDDMRDDPRFQELLYRVNHWQKIKIDI